jgi:hypothetical protein
VNPAISADGSYRQIMKRIMMMMKRIMMKMKC